MGTSLLTNQSAMNALQTLRSIGDNMDTTQRRVSTGLRINEASDNTAYWSISSAMRSDRNTLSAVSDAMSLGKSQIDVADTTINKSKDYLDNISKSLMTAYEKGEGDVKKIQNDIKGNMEDIKSAVYSASLAEKNILGSGGATMQIAGAYRREGSNVYVDMINVGGATLNFAKPADGKPGQFDLTQGVLQTVFGTKTDLDLTDETLKGAIEGLANAQKAYDAAKASGVAADIANAKTALGTANDAASDGANASAYAKLAKAKADYAANVKGMTVADFVNTDLSSLSNDALKMVIDAVQSSRATATDNVITAGATLGAAKAQVTGQIDYVSKLMDAIDKGVGSLVDADMNAESARLASLQVQQQLGIQALSIANQNSQNILSLFRQ
ncbi:flagellin N-terminal helical domain-containing protein [Bartonella apis]|uniref:flagellin N-terminal helical domain-containing protein n=1 Tax=Bartonella apis TaxID=1686310 RepID=UPI0018DE50CE|nr:flagellin [Bartonella apis]MBI0176703.1 flagellin [Bartonella apis]